MISRKRRRITQACDFCHRRGLKCKAPPEQQGTSGNTTNPSPCLTCTEHGQECTRSRQPRKRGTKPRAAVELRAYRPVESVPLQSPNPSSLGSRRTVTALLDVYLDSIHPTFPLFCERELWVGWRDGSFPSDPYEQLSLTCMCALSAQHVGKKALFTDGIDEAMGEHLQVDYLAEAIRQVPEDFETGGLNLTRSYGFLALLGAQKGNNAMLHKYLGLYHGICAQSNFQDESRWPDDITDCEREARRRVWWAMYRLEVHTACVLGSLVRSSEAQCNVNYPCGTHHPAFIPGRNGEFEDWFAGWNTTTDLYRVLEHVILDFRTKNRPSHSILGPTENARSAIIMRKLAKLQQDLLPRFGSVSSRSDDSGRNRCGFQASNILCTIHLARLLSCISSGDDIQLACQTAHDMVDSMRSIPLEYFRAIGSPLIQQLAGVGHILIGIVRKRPVVKDQYIGIREAVLSIISLLERMHQKDTVGMANVERLTSQLAEADMTQDAEEANSRKTGDLDDWNSFQDMEYLENHNDNEGFPTQLLTTFSWPYMEW